MKFVLASLLFVVNYVNAKGGGNGNGNGNNNPTPTPQPTAPQSPVAAPTEAPIQQTSCHETHYPFGTVVIDTEVVLCRQEFAVGFDTADKIPLWTAYHLTRESVALSCESDPAFRKDPYIASEYQADNVDYENNDWDKGHLAPRASIDVDCESETESVYYTNAAPQHYQFNRGGWKAIEGRIRNLVDYYGDAYVITGVQLIAPIEKMNDNVVIPTKFYKAIYVPSINGGIAVYYDNSGLLSSETARMEAGIMSISELELHLGMAVMQDIPAIDRPAAVNEMHADLFIFLMGGTPPDPTPQPTAAPTAAPIQQTSCHETHYPFGTAIIDTEVILCRQEFAVGFDTADKIPLWTAYHLTSESVALSCESNPDFRKDPYIASEYQADNVDYENNDWDKGHLAPRASIDVDCESETESVYYTNAAPQHYQFNRGGWKAIEGRIRNLVDYYGDAYIITGVQLIAPIEKMNDNVVIPKKFYKAIYVPSINGGIAVYYDNSGLLSSETTKMEAGLMSISDLELRLGFPVMQEIPAVDRPAAVNARHADLFDFLMAYRTS